MILVSDNSFNTQEPSKHDIDMHYKRCIFENRNDCAPLWLPLLIINGDERRCICRTCIYSFNNSWWTTARHSYLRPTRVCK